MPATKVAVTIETDLLREVDQRVATADFPNRSKAIQRALALMRDERSRRHTLLRRIARHMADHVTFIGLHYGVNPGAISNRVLGVSTQWPGPNITWNAHEWDVRG